MKKWVRNALTVSVGLGLFSSNLVPYNTVSADTLNNSVSAITIDQPQLQQRIDKGNEKFLSEDTLVIKYTKPLSLNDHKRAGGTLLRQFSGLNYAVVKVKDKRNLQKVMGKYKSLGQVTSVYPSALYKPFATPDPKISEQYYHQMLSIEKAQSLAGKNPVTVAVIDQGIDMGHPELKGRLLPGYNAVNPMNQGLPDFHGTHVAGIIAGNKGNGIGGFGVNPNVKILPIDIAERGWGVYDFAVADAILHAVDKGVKVINMSFGGPMK